MKHLILLVVLSVAALGSSWAQSPDPVNNPISWWNTFLGGIGDDSAGDIAVDSSGNSYITGTSSSSWGTPLRAFSVNGNNRDAFIVKLNAIGVLQWLTFLGGTGDDSGNGIFVDGSGNIFVTGGSGWSWSSPLNPHQGNYDAFVAKLDANGTLQWNTFLGGLGNDGGASICPDKNGNIFIAGGSTASWGSPMNSYSGSEDAFVAKLNSAGSLQWNAFLGGGGIDHGDGIAIDSFDGSVCTIGQSYATWGNPLNPFPGSVGTFVAKFATNGLLQWFTFLKGFHSSNGITVDGNRNIYAVSSELHIDQPIHVTKLGRDGYSQWESSMGGDRYHHDTAGDIAIDSNGNVYVSGSSSSTWGSPQDPFTGGMDTFLARLDANGVIQWNTFLGGSSDDWMSGIAVDGGDNVYVAGSSQGTWSSPLRPWTGLYDGFVAKIFATPFLKVASPNGGETFPWGSKQAVTWDSDDIQGTVKLVLFKDGLKVGNIVTDLPITPGSYTWTVGSYIGGTAAPGTGYTVRVITINGIYSDFSNAPFTITPLRLISPNGYENWQIHSVHPITWTAPGLSSTLKLVLFKDTMKIGNIATDLPASSGSYSWTIPSGTGAFGTGYWVRVITMNGVNRDESDARFSITAQSQLRITSPNGGEVWPWYHFRAITWTNGSYTGNVKLVLFKNGVKLGNIVVDIPANSSPFNWGVGNYIGGGARSGEGYSIRVISMDGVQRDESNGPFAIQ